MFNKIKENDSLHIFVDSENFERSLSNIKERLLSYNKIDCFDFLRSNYLVRCPEILSIEQNRNTIAADYTQQIETISRNALNHRALSEGEKEFLSLILFHKAFYLREYPNNFLFPTVVSYQIPSVTLCLIACHCSDLILLKASFG